MVPSLVWSEDGQRAHIRRAAFTIDGELYYRCICGAEVKNGAEHSYWLQAPADNQMPPVPVCPTCTAIATKEWEELQRVLRMSL